MKVLGISKPHLVIMIGIPGSGKSFFAEHFAETFKAPIISFNKLRKNAPKLISHTQNDNKLVHDIADCMLDEVLKTERTVIYDGEANSRTERDNITKKAKQFGYEPLFVWVQTELLTAKKRAIRKTDNEFPLTAEEFDVKLKKFIAPSRSEKTIVISGKHTYPSQLKIVLKYLIEPRDEIENHKILVN